MQSRPITLLDNHAPKPSTNGVGRPGKHDNLPVGDQLRWVIKHNSRLRTFNNQGSDEGALKLVILNGHDLSLAEVVAVSCHRARVAVSGDSTVASRVNKSVEFLDSQLKQGATVYGINTGFGGSADTRSRDYLSVQRALIQHQNSGILRSSDVGGGDEGSGTLACLKPHSLPRVTTRGAMLVRANSLLRGHSAVRLSVVESILTLLNSDCVPVIPLRGSISASGDLMPLSYLAGALEGNRDIYVDCCLADGKRRVLNAAEALQLVGLSPMTMGPKEGLGLINGTAVSCAAAALALHETQYLALMSQVLTSMCTEALGGSADSFHPFISNIRPHPGQKEVAENLSRQLKNSKFVVSKDARASGLYQDRYDIRTAPQWIGPQLEDLQLAARQLEDELNSTTDNPLIDAEASRVHHGGNFQATSVTSAMEKTRLALQMLGRLMFAQTSELVNPALNNVLTPNLCFDDPDASFTFKGVDINMAGYMSELGFLATPVSSHVQSAELHNQSVNSLALISARYTLEAAEVVSLMVAASLYAVVQALDLHALYREYTLRIEHEARTLFEHTFSDVLSAGSTASTWEDVSVVIGSALISTKGVALPQRAIKTAEATIIPITKALLDGSNKRGFEVMSSWTEQLAHIITRSITCARQKFASNAQGEGPTTMQYLGQGSATMYRYVRQDLGIPLHRGLVEHPAYPEESRAGITVAKEERRTVGSRISQIYAALRSGAMREVIVESLL